MGGALTQKNYSPRGKAG